MFRMLTKYTIEKVEDFESLTRGILNVGFSKPVILLLNGDLGSGKTTFIKYLGFKLGIKEEINSPTFIIHNEYQNKEKGIELHHIDLYRLEESFEFQELHLGRYLNPNTIIAIEWANKFEEQIEDMLAQKQVEKFKLNFSYESETIRIITLEKS